MFPAHPSGFAPEAMGSRLAYLLATAILKLDPASGNITIGTGVSKWANTGTAGSSLDVTQATGSKQPTWSSTGGSNGGASLTFAAASVQLLQSGAYTWNQPSTVLLRAKVTDSTTNRNYCDGLSSQARRMFSNTGDTIATIQAPTSLNVGGMTNGAWRNVIGVFNGASSLIATTDGGGSTSGAAGTNTASGFTLGARGDGAIPFNGIIDWVFGWNYALSATDFALMNAWLALR